MLSRRTLLLAFAARRRLRVLIVDGRNNHDWQSTTPVLKRVLEETGRFEAAVSTAPAGNGPVDGFAPRFKDHDAVLLNYTDFGNGGTWPESARQDFVEYVKSGGGVVVFHAASSAFGEWPEFNRIIGVGGWAGRDERSGPMVRFRDGRLARDMQPGKAGHHGKQHEYAVTVRDSSHPIMRGLPPVWMHVKDELYDTLRGPAEQMEVLATAWSDPATGGTGEHEPALMTIRYGKGRIFHTILGHDPAAMDCAGFALTLARGTEWCASGTVTIAVPEVFPTATRSIRHRLGA